MVLLSDTLHASIATKLSPPDTEVATVSTMCVTLQSQLYIGPRSRRSAAVFVAPGILSNTGGLKEL